MNNNFDVIRLTANDYEEAIDLMDFVFSQSSCPHIFEKALPKMCVPDDEHMSKFFACRKNGRLKAILGVFPLTTYINDKKFVVSSIENVATHRNERGSGMMRALMTEAMEELKRTNTDISRLGGLRQRYSRYGYEHAGLAYSVTVTTKNIREYYNGTFNSNLTFKELKAEDKDDLRNAWDFYKKDRIVVDRLSINDFYLTCISWFMSPWGIYRDGELVGYLTTHQGYRGIGEIHTTDTDTTVEAICAWLGFKGVDSVSLQVPPYAPDMLKKLTMFAEGFSMGDSCQFKIINFQGITDAFLKIKSDVFTLLDGECTVEILDYGKITLSKNGKETSCEFTDKVPNITVDKLTATRLLFGPFPADYVADIPTEKAALLSNWLPLPLFWNAMDKV